MTNKTKCKCECHIPTIGKYAEGKKISASICSECVENHKRSEYYRSLKAISKLTGEIFK